jgi:multidrug transporter EmrE-like cation transporter
MLLQRIIIKKVLGIAALTGTITDVASFMVCFTMLKELVNRIEAGLAKFAVWVAFKPALVFRTRLVISMAFMPP